MFDADDVVAKGIMSENFDEDIEDSSEAFDEMALLGKQNESFLKEQN